MLHGLESAVIGELLGESRRDKANGTRQEGYPDQQEPGTGGPTLGPVVQPPSPREIRMKSRFPKTLPLSPGSTRLISSV